MEDQLTPPALPNETERNTISLLRVAQESIAQIGTRALTLFRRTETDDAPDPELFTGMPNSPDLLAIETDQGEQLGQPGTALSRIRNTAAELRARARAHKRHLLGAVAAASTAFAAPFVVPEVFKNPAAASAAEVDQGTGGYPWANAEIGSSDDYYLAARECASYVNWKLIQQGIPPARANAAVSGTELPLDQFETVNKTPAAGAVIVFPNHVQYVDAISDGMITVSDYNGLGGPYKYGQRTVPLSMIHPDAIFIHYELPPVANGAFIGSSGPDKEKKNVLSQRQNNLYRGTYIKSANERYVLLFGLDGNLAAYDTQDNFRQLWQSGTANKGGDMAAIEIHGKKQNNLLTIQNEDGDVIWKLVLGKGVNKLTVNDNGTLSGLKGNKVVWRNVKDLKGVPRAAKAAARRQARIVAARKARQSKAHSNKAAKSKKSRRG